MLSRLQPVGQWFTLGTPVSYTNKIDRHDLNEILVKVALNTITITPMYKGQSRMENTETRDKTKQNTTPH